MEKTSSNRDVAALTTLREWQASTISKNVPDLNALPDVSQEIAARNEHILLETRRQLLVSDAPSVSVENIATPQDILAESFFAPTLESSSLTNFETERIERGSNCSAIQNVVTVDPEQYNLIRRVGNRELTNILNETVAHMSPVSDGFINQLNEVIPYLFTLENLNITVVTVLGLFQVTHLVNIMTSLISAEGTHISSDIKKFITFFRPILLPYTNVVVWARYTFLGVNSLHNWVISCLNQSILMQNLLANSIGRFSWMPYLINLENARDAILSTFQNFQVFVSQNRSFIINLFLGGIGSVLVLFTFQLVNNPTGSVKYLIQLFQHLGFFPSTEKALLFIKEVVSPVFLSFLYKTTQEIFKKQYDRVISNYDSDQVDRRIDDLLFFLESLLY
jgi:hypothetical protein